MKRQKQTYLGYLFLFLRLLTGFAGEVQAQRALKHRTGQLTADSIRMQHVTDSLALLDTLSLQRQQQIDALEAPVDTAALASQSDSIQKAAQNALEGFSGASVVIDPKTGAVLALASSPTYNAADIETLLQNSSNSSDSSALYNRATQALYPPGSTF